MKRSILLILLLFLVTYFTGCMEKPQDTEAMIAAADEMDQKFFDAYNNKDLETIKELYWNSPDLVSYPPGEMELKGYDAVIESFRKDFEDNFDGRIEIISLVNRPIGDVVYGTGTWRFIMQAPDGSEIEIEGRYLDIKAERDGKWVYIADHASIPLPPPGEADVN